MSLIQQALEKADEDEILGGAFQNEKAKSPRAKVEIRKKIDHKIKSLSQGEKVTPQSMHSSEEQSSKRIWVWALIFVVIGIAFAGGFYVLHQAKLFEERPSNQSVVTMKTAFAPIIQKDEKNNESISEIKLSGITYSGGQRLALINDEIYAAGDTIAEGVRVKNILVREVILDIRGKEKTLTL